MLALWDLYKKPLLDEEKMEYNLLGAESAFPQRTVFVRQDIYHVCRSEVPCLSVFQLSDRSKDRGTSVSPLATRSPNEDPQGIIISLGIVLGRKRLESGVTQKRSLVPRKSFHTVLQV